MNDILRELDVDDEAGGVKQPVLIQEAVALIAKLRCELDAMR